MSSIRNFMVTGRALGFVYVARVEAVAPRKARTLSIRGPVGRTELARAKPSGVSECTPFDHRGHLIADRFGGPNRRANLVAMHGLINMSSHPWFQMESRVAELIGTAQASGGGQLVGRQRALEMEVSVEYDRSSLLRPMFFQVNVRDGMHQVLSTSMPNFNPYLLDPERAEREMDAVGDEVSRAFGLA